MMCRERMVELARQARENAYAPYSGFRVGACLVTAAGNVYTGCNVENAAHSPACCAERNAVFQAVARGEREFAAVCVVAGERDPVWPCGVCLQVLSEFSRNMRVVTASLSGEVRESSIDRLLPCAFGDYTEG